MRVKESVQDAGPRPATRTENTGGSRVTKPEASAWIVFKFTPVSSSSLYGFSGHVHSPFCVVGISWLLVLLLGIFRRQDVRVSQVILTHFS